MATRLILMHSASRLRLIRRSSPSYFCFPVQVSSNNNFSNHERCLATYVSRHNKSLNVTVDSILAQLPHQPYRTTTSHVIFQECPFCTKPVGGKADNQYKLYVQLQGGAYFCHRCGAAGSWFDFKERTQPNHPAAAASSSNSTGNSPRILSHSHNNHNNNHPLPMPSPRLQALYSSQLLDAPTDTTSNNNNNTLSLSHAALTYLTQQRGLTKKTLRRYGVGCALYQFPNQQQHWEPVPCLTFPWIMAAKDVAYQEELLGRRATTFDNKNGNDDETYLTRRIKVRGIHQKSQQRLDPAGGGWGLFGYHTVPRKNTGKDAMTSKEQESKTDNDTTDTTDNLSEIVLTEGEFDAMSVWQATGRPALSLPNGARSLPVEVLPLLEDFDRIYLWMDHDAAGREGAQGFAKKLGLERTYLVQPTLENTGVDAEHDLPKDANDALRMGLDLERLIVDAKPVPHEQILQFADLRHDVLHEIMYPEMYTGLPIASLPKFTGLIKGLRRGELTVLTGPTGSGKTTFLGQMSLDLAEQDINVLWGSFEIKNSRLMHKLLQQFARQPLPAGDPSCMGKLNEIADRFAQLPLHFMRFHGGSDVDEVLDAMEYAVYVNDTQHIILDNMQFMISRQGSVGSSWDKFDVQDVAIEKFRKFATERNVHVTLVVHPKKQEEDSKLSISSFYGSAKATQEADTVIILQSESGKKYLDVRKNRFNGELGQTELFFDRQSCRYTEAPPIHNKPKPRIEAQPSQPQPDSHEDHWNKLFNQKR